jgi:sarcosine oxidase/L-pipecolate oxidase
MVQQSFVIVGAGIFGVSTARAAKQKHPDAEVRLISDTPIIEPASRDTSKIIRRAYKPRFYVDLADEAMGIWKSDPVYSEFWHQSGWVVLSPSALESLPEGSTIVSQDEFRTIRESAFREADLSKTKAITEDKRSAWVEASNALQKTIDVAKTEGVIYVEGRVESLLWDETTCTGVKLTDGTEIPSSSTILALGHWTPDFLRKQNIPFEEDLSLSAGVSVLGIRLTEDQYAKYKDMPILAVPGEGMLSDHHARDEV